MFNSDKELEEAMKHATEVAKDKKQCKECREEHRKLAQWLLELMVLRKKYAEESE